MQDGDWYDYTPYGVYITSEITCGSTTEVLKINQGKKHFEKIEMTPLGSRKNTCRVIMLI